MKKFIILLLMFFTLIPVMEAQTTTQGEQIVVNTNDLPPAVLEAIKEKNELQRLDQKIQTYGKWAGMGKEVGIAINDGLTAVKDVSIEFSESDLGLFTMGMIAWQVMGEDAVRIIIGVLLMIVSIILITRSYFKTCTRTKLYENGKVPLLMRPFKTSGEYNYSEAQYSDGGGAVLHLLAFLGTIGITYAVAFA